MSVFQPAMPHTPVAIVGGGPVGLMLAMFLDFHGVACTVFNTERTVRPHPKGSTQNSRTMEHYRRLGFAHRVRELGLPTDHPTDVAYFTRFSGWELARLPMPSEEEKRRRVIGSSALDQVPEPVHRANQMYVEQVLLEEAASRPGITLKFGVQVTDICQDNEGVTLTTVDSNSEPHTSWRASYAVGCDGGRSFVRKTLGISYEGFENLQQAFFGGRMISTYLRAPTLYRDFLGSRRAWQYWIVNPQIRTALVALNGKDEFLLWTRDERPDAPVEAEDVVAALRACAGTDMPVQIMAHGRWTAGVALVAERFAEGRILLAGDSAHLFTPTGGFGMNTGVDDAANLAWKLAAAVQGWGGRNLLATYETERKPIAHRNTTAARNLARSVGMVPVPPELEQDDAAGAKARLDTGEFLRGFSEEYASLGVQLGARYDGSPIVAADGPPPPNDTAQYVATSQPGGRAPHFWLDTGRDKGSSLFDRLGTGFTLLSFRALGADAARVQEAAQTRGIPLTILPVAHNAAHEFYGSDLILIRPDQHIAWRGNTVPENVAALLGTVTGAL